MRTVLALAVALLFALVGSYLVWTRPPATLDANKVSVYVATQTDVSKIQWSDDASTVVIERRNDSLGDYLWVTSTVKTEVIPVPVIEPAPTEEESSEEGGEGEEETPAPVIEPEPTYETTVRSFLGGKKVRDLWEKFTPFQAIRELPVSAASVDLGMDTPHGTIEVTRKSGVLSLVAGKETFGGKQRFLSVDARVFLINNSDISAFTKPEKLPETRVQPLNRTNALKVHVTHGGKERTLVRQNPADLRNSFWADPNTSDKKDAAAETWIFKLLDVKAAAYVADDEAKTLNDTLVSALKVTIEGEEDSWDVDILSDGSDSAQKYYGKSNYSRGLVELNAKAADVVADLNGFLNPAE